MLLSSRINILQTSSGYPMYVESMSHPKPQGTASNSKTNRRLLKGVNQNGNDSEGYLERYQGQQEEIKQLRRKYAPPQENNMDQLRELDRKAGNSPMIIALAVGIAGALILGGGMSAVMVGSSVMFVPGIIIG